MKRTTTGGAFLALFLAVVLAACSGGTGAQSGGAAVPFKLGTFERAGTPFLGLALQDDQIIDIGQANAEFENSDASAPRLAVPADMSQLISAYDAEWGGRLAEIARSVSTSASAPAYAYAIDSLTTLPPVRPGLILNGGGNYAEHQEGIAALQESEGAAPEPTSTAVSVPGIWEREAGDNRSNPYMFIKSPRTVIGAFDPIVVPRGRTNIDFECEFGVVIGRPAKSVPVDSAGDYIFGYTIEIDVSDRGGRGDQKMGGGPDWLVGKNHDTFGPLGPFIVPKEFMPEPMSTRHTFTLNETVMQDSNTERMTHNIYELLSYGSHLMTLHPGDVLAGGSPAGTNIERAEPRWMRAGDTAICTIEGIGTQRHPVVDEGSV